MSTTCDSCGYKSNEVKAGGAIAPKGKRITLKVQDKEDFSRDILKVTLSDKKPCNIFIPNLMTRSLDCSFRYGHVKLCSTSLPKL
jgi:zinc finger protein